MMTNQKLKEEPTYYLTEFSQILELTNREGKPSGEIAVTIMTPTQTVHALLGPNQKDSHEFLIEEICKDIFGEVSEAPNYCIEIRHVINSADDRYAYPTIPKVITNDEFDGLSEILDALLKKDTFIISMTTNINPTKAKNDPKLKRVAEFEDKDVLEYLLKNNCVREYDLPFEERLLEVPPIEEKRSII